MEREICSESSKSFCHPAPLSPLQVEMAQYEKGVQWLREALFRSQFVGQRVRVKANKLINSIGDRKRSGPKLLDLMFHNIVFKNSELQTLCYEQSCFLKFFPSCRGMFINVYIPFQLAFS